MNNKVVKIISSVVLLGGALILLIGTNFPKFEDLTLDEIKERIKETKKIYICVHREALTVACPKDERLKTIDNEDDVKKFVDITLSLEEKGNTVIGAGDGNTIYFMDKDDKVIISAEGFVNYNILTKYNKYELDVSRLQEIQELVGYPRFNE